MPKQNRRVDVKSPGGGGGGAQGPVGPTGPIGPAGPPGTVEEPEELWFVPGPQGTSGTPGAQGTPGPPLPLYEPDEPEPWILPGATGLTGTQGQQGVPGPPMPLYEPDEPEPWILPGATGIQGIQGTQGPAGFPGFLDNSVDANDLDQPLLVYAPPHLVDIPLYVNENLSFVVPDTGFLLQRGRLQLTMHGQVQGTGRVHLSDWQYDASNLRQRAPGSVTINVDEFVVEFTRINLFGSSRQTLVGTAEIQLSNLNGNIGGRLVLTGIGGGS